jgi:hypothetical protein
MLLWKGRICIDKETGEPTEFEFPLLGKIKTQSPVILMVAFAAALVTYPITQAKPSEGTLTVPIKADGKTVTVRLVPVPSYQMTVDSSGTYPLKFPLLRNTTTYLALYEIDHQIVYSNSVEISGGKVALPEYAWVEPPSEHIPVHKEGVSDAELKALGIQ